MKAMAALTVIVSLWSATDDQGASPERAKAVKFLKDHVIGKTIASAPVVIQTDKGKLEGVYEDVTTFSNLVETADGFQFDVTSVSKETHYDLDKAGKRIEPGKSLNGVRVFRYEIVERKSTKKLIGFGRNVTTTVKDDPFSGAVWMTQVFFDQGKLVTQDTQAGYNDFLGAKGTYRAVASDVKTIYEIKGGKLEVRADQTTFDVDAETLKRTPTKDQLPTYVGKEVEQK